MCPAKENNSDRQWARAIAEQADAICRLILSSDYPLIDVQIQRSKLLDSVEQLAPERLELYEMIYETRFERLIEQFRCPDDDW